VDGHMVPSSCRYQQVCWPTRCGKSSEILHITS
jgi:hypothetical protein